MTEYKPLHIESNKNQHARGRAGTQGANYERTRGEQESQEDREARLDRKASTEKPFDTQATLGTSASQEYALANITTAALCNNVFFYSMALHPNKWYVATGQAAPENLNIGVLVS